MSGCKTLYNTEAKFFEIENKLYGVRNLTFDSFMNLIGAERLLEDMKERAYDLITDYTIPISYKQNIYWRLYESS